MALHSTVKSESIHAPHMRVLAMQDGIEYFFELQIGELCGRCVHGGGTGMDSDTPA